MPGPNQIRLAGCRYGHVHILQDNDTPQTFCEMCGNKIIDYCPYCESSILGTMVSQPRLPAYCLECNQPYPWTEVTTLMPDKGGVRVIKSEQEYERELIREFVDKAEKDMTSEPLTRLLRVLDRFPSVYRQLQRRYGDRSKFKIDDEHDAHDLLHSLLCIDFEDIRREDPAPAIAGGSARLDLLLKPEQIVIELKIARKHEKGHSDREIGDELIVDLTRYITHPDCKTLVFFIWDPDGNIKNPRGLSRDIENHSTESRRVLVRIGRG